MAFMDNTGGDYSAGGSTATGPQATNGRPDLGNSEGYDSYTPEQSAYLSSQPSGASNYAPLTQLSDQGTWPTSNPQFDPSTMPPSNVYGEPSGVTNGSGFGGVPSGAPTSGPPAPSGPGSAPSSAFNPAYLSQQFPNGIPSALASQSTVGGIPNVGAQSIMGMLGGNFGYDPAQTSAQTRYDASQINGPTSYDPMQAGGPTSYNAAMARGRTGYNVAQTGVDTSAGGFTDAMYRSMAPQFSSQNRALAESLAANGIVGGSAPAAQQQLGVEQQNAFQGAIQPGLLQMKGNELNQAQTNAGWQNAEREQQVANALGLSKYNAGVLDSAAQFGISSGLDLSKYNTAQGNQARQFGITTGLDQSKYNAAARDAASQFGITSGLNLGESNTQQANNAAQYGAGQRLNAATTDAGNNLAASRANQDAALNAGEFNAAQGNANSQYDISNQIQAAMGDNATYNSYMQSIMDKQNQDWLAQMGQAGNLAQNTAAGTSDSHPNYIQPAPSSGGFASLGAGLGGYTPPTTVRSTNTTTTPPASLNAGMDPSYWGSGGG